MGNAKPKDTEVDEEFADELKPGTELLQGQYKIDRFLNAGGFGMTYLAFNSLERQVVIKECFPSSFCHRNGNRVQPRSRSHQSELESIVRLFVQEARSLAKLQHPNIVGVHQVFEDNDTAYMALDFVQGRDMLDILEDENSDLTAPQIKGILKDVLGAVAYIHDQEILHRDISPDNILLDDDLRPVLIDFGAAREQATKQSRVLSALRVVKDGYSPQEFYVQGSEQSPSSDLYALGATFYHLIDGDIPPNSQARLAAIAAGEQDPYEPLADRIKGHDRKVLAAIDKALGILPKDRVQSASEWLESMEGARRKSRVVTTPVAPISSAAAETAASESRSKLVPLLGSVAAIAVIAAVGYVFVSGSTDQGTPEAAASELAENVETPAPVETASEAVEEAATPVAPADTAVAEADPVVEPETTAPETGAEIAGASEATTEPETIETVEVAPEPVIEPAANAPAIAAAPQGLSPAAQDGQGDVLALDLSKPNEGLPNGVRISVPWPKQRDDEQAAASQIALLKERLANEDTSAPAANVEAPQSPDNPFESGTPVLSAALSPDSGVDTRFRGDFVAPEGGGSDAIALSNDLFDVPSPRSTAVEIQDLSSVLSGWTVLLPFSGASNSNVIETVATVAPIWVQEGLSIVSLNGQELTSFSDISSILRSQIDPGERSTIEIAFGIGRDADGNFIEQRWAVPVVQETVLLNGLTFTTRFDNDTWRTFVSEVPQDNLSDLEIGDEIVAYIPTSEPLTTRTAMRDIFTRELANDVQQFSFAVSREGSMWVASLNYSGGI